MGGIGEGVVQARCETCNFYCRRGAIGPYGPYSDCRKNSPQISQDNEHGVWPGVNPSDWCGAWYEVIKIEDND